MNKTSFRFASVRTAVSAALFLYACVCSWAYGGAESGAKKLAVVKTTYFDIIYPPESEQAAQKIAAVCDSDYLEICSLLGTEPYQRFPVTITHSVDSLNAYFSPVLYNSIVLYDTVPSSSLDMFENTIESVFYHELTHAVTLNMKNKFWRVMSGIFSDALTPAYLTLTTFWEEGATVSFESRSGGGRLNNPFSMQIVAQAKIENRFPSWRDVTGARDTYPGGTDAYIFGAAFAKYLQDSYGMEKYGDFWRAAGSHLSPAFVSGVFKSVYDKKITDVWNDFRDSYAVPEITDDTRADIRDFFTEAGNEKIQKNGFTKTNNKKSVFSYIDSCSNGIVWCDSACGAVWYVPVNESSSKNKPAQTKATISYGKPKKICTMTGICGMSLSADGTRIAVSRLVQKDTVKSEVVVFELSNPGTKKCSVKRLYTAGGTGLREGCILDSADGKETYAACVRTTENHVKIELYKINKNSAEKKCVRSIALSDGELPFCLNDAGSGRLALVCKKGLSWSVRVYAPDFCSYNSFSPGGRNCIIRNLHAALREKQHAVFTFSWAELGSQYGTESKAESPMLARAGTLDVLYGDGINSAADTAQALFTLQKNDFSGGVTNAVGMRPNLVYTASFYDTTRLMVMNGVLAVDHFDAVTAHSACGEDTRSAEITASPEAAVKPYNPFGYFTRGVFIPFGTVPVYSHNNTDGQTGNTLLGATWITSDPWRSTILLASAGYDTFSESGGALAEFVQQNDRASLSLAGTALFDSKGFLQSRGSGSASYTAYAGNVSSVSLAASGYILYGRSYNGYITETTDVEGSTETKSYADKENDFFTTAEGKTGITFSNVHKCASGYKQYAGVYAEPFVTVEYNSGWFDRTKTPHTVDHGYSNAGAEIAAYVPGLFPLTVTASLFPSSSYFLSASASAVLFSYEIQKGIPAVSLYADRLVLSASYTAYESYGKADSWDIADTVSLMQNVKTMDYSDLCTVGASVILSANTGAMATSSIQCAVGGELRYRPNFEEGKKKISGAFTCILVY